MGFLTGTKADILRILSRGPNHGYAIARELKLTLSTVYEHLKEFEDNNLVTSEQEGRRREVRLTARGRTLANLLPEPTSDASRERKRERSP